MLRIWGIRIGDEVAEDRVVAIASELTVGAGVADQQIVAGSAVDVVGAVDE